MQRTIDILIKASTYTIVVLLTWTAANKVTDYAVYQGHIGDVGLMPMWLAKIVSPAIILLELSLAVLLLNSHRRGKVWAWRILLVMMGAYSYYVYYIINIFILPVCSCRGVSNKLGWTDHYWLNGAVALIALANLIYYYRKQHFTKTEEHSESIVTNEPLLLKREIIE